MQHFLIPGGAGYLGSVLIPRLLAEGYQVTVIDQFYFGRDTLPQHPNLICLKQDIRHLALSQLTKIDAIIDLAAMSNDPCGEAFSTLTEQINFRTRVRTATLARQAGVKRYILSSSCSVYGFQTQRVNELSAVNPLTVYAQSNLNAEQGALQLASDDFCVTVLRLATIFGYSPRMRLDLVVNAMTYNAWKNGEIIISGGGTQARPLLHVKDAVSLMIRVLQAETQTVNRQILNAGGDRLNYIVNEIAQDVATIYQKIMSTRPRIIHNGPQDLRSYHVDFGKVTRLLGWQPKLNIKTAARDLLERLTGNRLHADQRCYTLDWYCNVLTSADSRSFMDSPSHTNTL